MTLGFAAFIAADACGVDLLLMRPHSDSPAHQSS
ncbi:hypothetical protein ABH941_001517 [Streptacidiphilus sp. EB103A]